MRSPPSSNPSTMRTSQHGRSEDASADTHTTTTMAMAQVHSSGREYSASLMYLTHGQWRKSTVVPMPTQACASSSIPTDTPTEATMHSLEDGVEALIEGDTCTIIEDGESMTPVDGGSCFRMARWYRRHLYIYY